MYHQKLLRKKLQKLNCKRSAGDTGESSETKEHSDS